MTFQAVLQAPIERPAAADALVVARNGGQLAGIALAAAFWTAQGGGATAYWETFRLLAAIACAAALVAALGRGPRVLPGHTPAQQEET